MQDGLDDDWLAAEAPRASASALEPAPAHSRGVHRAPPPSYESPDERPAAVTWALRVTTVAAMVWVAIGGALLFVAVYQKGTDDPVAQAGWADFSVSLGLSCVAVGGVLFLAAAATRALSVPTWVLALGIHVGMVVVGLVWLPPALLSALPLALLAVPAAKDYAVAESKARAVRRPAYAPQGG